MMASTNNKNNDSGSRKRQATDTNDGSSDLVIDLDKNKNENNDSGSRKRQVTDANYDSSDPIIGLDVGGKIFYTHRSTLMNGSAYFAARFGGSFSAGNSVTDGNERDVYFIDACPELFEQILNFLRRGIPTWPNANDLYRDDPVLYKRLVGEAEYLGIESMLESLRLRFEPDGSGKDILYWLGTNGGSKEYENPLDTGAVSLGGTCLQDANKEISEPSPDGWDSQDERVNWQVAAKDSQKNFTQHRPLCGTASMFDCPVARFPPERSSDGGTYVEWYQTDCFLFRCDDSVNENYLDITFEKIAVRPTHYSLRYSDCCGMTCWDFDASADGQQWTCLHQARGDMSIAQPSEGKRAQLIVALKAKCKCINDICTRQSIATSIVEKELRHVWKVETSETFYRYFRLKGVGDDCVAGTGACMHGAGFELYGEIACRLFACLLLIQPPITI